MRRAFWLTRANASLTAICQYIAADDPVAANRLARRIDEKIALLREFPHIGSPAEDGTRKFSIGGLPYIIRYRIEPDRIVIVDIRHMARR